MALTSFQRRICRVLAERRKRSGESYVAGGVALNQLLGGTRLSRAIDLFHDTEEALASTWAIDRAALESAGHGVRPLRELRSFVEAEVTAGSERVLVQWARESAFRFFPLIEDEELGLVLHPFDLATNKTLALVGRLEVRDWVDLIVAIERLVPLGYLAWAACGKDPAFSPASILAHAARSSRYSKAEVQALEFEGDPPDAAELARRWHAALDEARTVIDLLPAEEAGKCVLARSGELYGGGSAELRRAVAAGDLRFHAGRIRGAWPEFLG